MELVVLWIALAIAVGMLAGRYDRSGFLWFIIAVLISPLIAGIIVMSIGESGKTCPQCAETVKHKAKVCRYCGYSKEYQTEADLFD